MKHSDEGDISYLLEIMAGLRDPVRGCPWDVGQDFRSIAPFTLEEAYEVADAIDRNDLTGLRDELGDLLLQVVFHAQMASEQGAFDFGDVVCSISRKLVRRHPHVFAGGQVTGAEHQHAVWEDHKARERASGADTSTLAGIAQALPALMRADKLARRAARVGFDWPDAAGVTVKLEEELAELEAARQAGDVGGIAEEIGDLLFSCASLARHLGVNPEEALRLANNKFERRFRAVEGLLQVRGMNWDKTTPLQLDGLWEEVKGSDRQPRG